MYLPQTSLLGTGLESIAAAAAAILLSRGGGDDGVDVQVIERTEKHGKNDVSRVHALQFEAEKVVSG